MYKYVLKRLLLIIPVVLFVLFVVYTIMALTPGDPCRMILGVEENILLLRPEGSAEGAPMLRITVGHESDLQAGAAVRVALDYSKLLLL